MKVKEKQFRKFRKQLQGFLKRINQDWLLGCEEMMGRSENIIVSERIRGVFGEHDDRYEIAGDNREVCESKRRLKAKESRTDEIIWRLWKRGTQARKAQVAKECVSYNMERVKSATAYENLAKRESKIGAKEKYVE